MLRWNVVVVSLILMASVVPQILAQPTPAVVIEVTEEKMPVDVTYNYLVTNHSTLTIGTIFLGYNWTTHTAELEDETTSVQAPDGWTGTDIRVEESDYGFIKWSSTDPDDTVHEIPPGQELEGFQVTLPKPSAKFSKATWSVIFTNAKGTMVGQVTPVTPPRSDTTPPTVSVTASPSTLWSPNHELVPITVTVQVTDNQDSRPTVRLVSIVTNDDADLSDIVDAEYGTDDRSFKLRAERKGKERGGRQYVITYSATDASGNAATATTTVTVPHDQG